MQWVQDPSQSNVDNIKQCKIWSQQRFQGGKKKEYLKAKIEELENNSKRKNIGDLYRGIDFKKGYQPRSKIVKDEKGDMVTDCHSILARWRNYFSQLFNVRGVNDVRQTEIHTAEPLVPEPSAFEFEMAIEKLKIYKLPGIDQISAEYRVIHKSLRDFRTWLRNNQDRHGRKEHINR